MRRVIIAVLAVAVVMGAMVAAQAQSVRPAISSGLVTATSTVRTGAASLTGVLILTNGAADATVVVYDNTAASGTILFQGTVAAAANFGGATWEIPLQVTTGLHVTIAGAGASAIIYYVPQT